MTRSAAVVLTLLLSTAPVSAQVDPELLAGMKARAIGPAAMSGRVADVTAVESNPDIVYVGAATGGLWKSTNGGLTFEPLFDEQPVAAIGAVAIFQRNPDIVWVGTGEANVRNSASVGNGVYRSLDGGKTWKHAGLEKSERISRIILHPTDPDIAWVAALGPAWGEGGDRGVYRTDDGGRTWRNVLKTNPRAGAADLAIDPSNPDKLIASMWEFRRWPWFFHSGGPGSGLFITWDGGANWKRYAEEDGLPEGQLGRSGIAFSRSNPEIVYALVEAQKSALLRSTDGGRKWEKVNEDPNIASRPFYFDDIRVDPRDPNRIYSLATVVSVSEDGGKTFSTLVPWAKVHPDHHAMWINPSDPTHIIDGNDGGVAVSRDRGKSWQFVGNLALGQYYHVAYDMQTPYNIYGGMQDNGSWRGPSEVWENGGIRNQHWQEVGFGDGFAVVPIANDPQSGYSMSQEGHLMRWDTRTGEKKDIRPPAPDLATELRFNWNAAIAVDPFDPNGVYYGSQFVHKSTDRGESWSIISPDLTTNRKEWQKQGKSGGLTPDVTGAENFTTIMTIAPSTVDKGVIWVGSDDGRLHVTRDGGTGWTSVESNFKGVPANSWVPHIEASHFDAGTAYVVFDNHRRSDWTPYVYRTTDYGKTWTSLVTRDLRGYALTIVEDPVDRNLLFLGTEFGLFFTQDGGKRWMQWKHGIPTVSVMALAIHPREHDLIVGTHGRSAFVIDDIRPLRSMSAATLSKPAHLFEVPEAIQHRVAQTGGERFPADGEFRGENQPYGALLTFSLNAADLPHPREEVERERKERERATKEQPAMDPTGVPQEMQKDIPKEPLPVEQTAEEEMPKGAPKAEVVIMDASGRKIRSFRTAVHRGVNRTSWDLRRDAFKQPPPDPDRKPDENPSAHEILPGTYTATVKYKDATSNPAVIVVRSDPRTAVAAADRQAKWDALMTVGALQDRAVTLINRVRQAQSDIAQIEQRLKSAEADDPEKKGEASRAELRRSACALKKRLAETELLLWIPYTTKGIVEDKSALSRIQYAQYSLESSFDAPTPAQRSYVQRAEVALTAASAAVDELFKSDVARFRDAVRAAKLQLFAE